MPQIAWLAVERGRVCSARPRPDAKQLKLLLLVVRGQPRLLNADIKAKAFAFPPVSYPKISRLSVRGRLDVRRIVPFKWRRQKKRGESLFKASSSSFPIQRLVSPLIYHLLFSQGSSSFHPCLPPAGDHNRLIISREGRRGGGGWNGSKKSATKKRDECTDKGRRRHLSSLPNPFLRRIPRADQRIFSVSLERKWLFGGDVQF